MAWADAVYDKPAEKQLTATDSLPEIPAFFRAEPAVKEAQLILQGKSTSRPVPGRVIR